MSIAIDSNLCIGCGRCKKVCPGNLIKIGEKSKAYIRFEKDCWGCSSCLKECPVNAIKFFLGADIGGMGSVIHVENEGDITKWIVDKSDGTTDTIRVNTKESNKY